MPRNIFAGIRSLSGRSRTVIAIISCLAIAAAVATLPGSAANPANGTLTNLSGPLFYTAGPFNAANPTPIPQVDTGPECNDPSQPCDNYVLTVTLPSRYSAAHPSAACIARCENTNDSSRLLLARRLAPCTPLYATSPHAYRPGTLVAPSRSVLTPPIM